jgi:hypothetical protein
MIQTGQEVQLTAQQGDASASMRLIKPQQMIFSRLASAF